MKAEARPRFHAAVFHWYKNHGRILPWRGDQNPYRVLLSEVMLQQTQVSRVLEKYPVFLKHFPTLPALARAQRADVIRVWQGMGYNNRAVRLHQCAHIISGRYNGRFPVTEKELRELPGIGRYTARAVLSSALGMPVAVVDVNIQRVFSRFFWRMDTVAETVHLGIVEACAADHFPTQRGYDWNQALMDLGATVCTARAPRCGVCPVAPWCKSRTSMSRTGPVQMKREPLFYGVPERIYRGRIVNRLRAVNNGHTITLTSLGTHILTRYTGRNEAWLRRLLERLERDGLVRLRKRGATTRVSLP